jgi:hypothetical protein
MCQPKLKPIICQTDKLPPWSLTSSLIQATVSQEKSFFWQGKMALLVNMGSALRSYLELATACSHKEVWGIGE